MLIRAYFSKQLKCPSVESMTESSLPAEDSFFIGHVWKGWLIGMYEGEAEDPSLLVLTKTGKAMNDFCFL